MAVLPISSPVRVLIASILVLCGSMTEGFAQSHETILRALRDEAQRSMRDVRLPGVPAPYYVEYSVVDRTEYHIRAQFGTLAEAQQRSDRSLNSSVRVGTPKVDNTNFFDVGLGFFGSSDDEESFRNRRVALDADYNALRRELWLATDAAFKQSAEIFAKKNAALQNRAEQDSLPDFVVLPPERRIDTSSAPVFSMAEWQRIVTEVSAIAKQFPALQNSAVNIEYIPERRYFVSSEGREYVKLSISCGIEIIASTQAGDGMPLANTYSVYAKSPAQLPSLDSLKKVMTELCTTLTLLTKAPKLDAYSGPVLFEGQAAGELFAQGFLPYLPTQRPMLAERGMPDNQRNTAFQNKIGGRVLPEFMSVTAKPTVEEFVNGTQHVSLFGSYKIDDDGIPAESPTIVDKGYLRTLLSSRIPHKRIKKSNGHQRGGAPMFGVIDISAERTKQFSSAELKKRLLKLCKDRELPFGIIVRKAINPNILYTTLFGLTGGDFPVMRGEGTMSLIEVYKVYADGKEELIRGAEAAGIVPQTFKDILALSKQKTAYNFYALSVTPSFFTGGAQFLSASIITPDVMIEDMEIRSLDGNFSKPPIAGHPHFDKR
jgi:hypothetical protein